MSRSRGRTMFVDASAGAAGDMLLAALVDAGAPIGRIRAALKTVPVGGWTIRSSRVTRASIAARRLDVRVRGDQPDRRFIDLRRIVRAATLAPRARTIALAAFRRLIEAEAVVHGVPAERVHLHEAGGVDAIVDVVGVATAVDLLAPTRIVVSPLTTGFGRVRCAHGDFPVPAPATLELTRGLPVRAGSIEAERLTPTGAALLATLADEWGELPPLRPASIGYGAGARELDGVANVLRVVLGDTEPAASDGEIVVLECNVDDATPQSLALTLERLITAGAYDASITPLVMKKGRPGHLLRVLAPPDRAGELAESVLRWTTTLGLRWRRDARLELDREVVRVRTRFGPVRIKIGRLRGEVVQRWPEFDDCAALARTHGVALEAVQHAALQATPPRRSRGRTKGDPS